VLLARRRNFLPVSLRHYDCQFYVLGFNNMFYSHEGELEFETLDAKSKTNCRSTHVAQIWRGDCVVCRKDVQLLLPSPDRGGRIVATLGQSSSLRRINRKQILEVDVSKACQTIVDPVAPMALRLQSNLLYDTPTCLL